MNQITRKRIGCTMLAALLLLLCGCSLISQVKESITTEQEEADKLLTQFMACVENNDVNGAASLGYDPQQVRNGFTSITDYWPAHAADEFELSGIHVTTSPDGSDGQRTVTDVVYLVHGQDQDYQVQFGICRDSTSSGITYFNVASVQDLLDNGITPEVNTSKHAKKSIGQWCFTGFWILSCILCLVTVIDIVRKKPKLWGLWILCALVFFGFFFDKGPSGIHLGIRFGLLNSSEWTRLSNGTNHYQLCLPFGAVLYWILRGTLLKKKNAPAYAVPVQPVPAQTIAPQAVPTEASPEGQPEPEQTADQSE